MFKYRVFVNSKGLITSSAQILHNFRFNLQHEVVADNCDILPADLDIGVFLFLVIVILIVFVLYSLVLLQISIIQQR